jgi:hypothetical protein
MNYVDVNLQIENTIYFNVPIETTKQKHIHDCMLKIVLLKILGEILVPYGSIRSRNI